MGYGKVLKEILDEKQMSVKTLSRNTGVPAPTIYSIIRRDTPIRYDTALRFANTLDIPLATICNENPYNEKDKFFQKLANWLACPINVQKKPTYPIVHQPFLRNLIIPICRKSINLSQTSLYWMI